MGYHGNKTIVFYTVVLSLPTFLNGATSAQALDNIKSQTLHKKALEQEQRLPPWK